MDTTLVKKIIRDCFRIDRIRYPRAPVLTVAHDNDRSLLHKGKYYSPLINTMEDDLALRGVDSVSIARIISTIKGERSYGRVYSPEGGFARAMVAKRLRAALRRADYTYSHREEAIWADILEQTGARKVFGIQPSRELCTACHKRGIWVADVQHGVIADKHPWYGVAFRGAEPAVWLPSAFLVWDQGSADVVAWSRAKGVAVDVIGNRWLARFARPAANDALAHELGASFALAAESPARPIILLTLSWGSDIPDGHIPAGLEAVIRTTSDRYRWLIRLHPNQLCGFASHEGPDFMRYFDRVLAGHAEWEVATRAPLPVVLRHTALHISWNSSVCIEAAQMGIRSALLDPGLRVAQVRGDYYTYYREAGLVDLVEETEASIRDWVARNIDSKQAAQSFEASDSAYGRVLDLIAGQSAS